MCFLESQNMQVRRKAGTLYSTPTACQHLVWTGELCLQVLNSRVRGMHSRPEGPCQTEGPPCSHEAGSTDDAVLKTEAGTGVCVCE